MKIIYQNDSLYIVNKPNGYDFSSVLQKLRETDPHALGVHRLDRETSGLMIFAKSKKVQGEISSFFARKQIQKTYLAISRDRPKKKQGWIEGDIVKQRSGNLKLAQTQNNPSLTYFQSFLHSDTGFRYFLVRPLTGKTHQIRVVLKSLGSAILGDTRYGKQPADRMYLHCLKLRFSWQGQWIEEMCLPAKDNVYETSFIQDCLQRFELDQPKKLIRLDSL